MFEAKQHSMATPVSESPMVVSSSGGYAVSSPNAPVLRSDTEGVQPKLRIGKPNDREEIEADGMAEKVVTQHRQVALVGSMATPNGRFMMPPKPVLSGFVAAEDELADSHSDTEIEPTAVVNMPEPISVNDDSEVQEKEDPLSKEEEKPEEEVIQEQIDAKNRKEEAAETKLQEEIKPIKDTKEESVEQVKPKGIPPELSQWKHKVAGATGRVAKPKMPVAGGAASDIKGHGSELADKKKKNRPNYVESVEAALPPSPKVEKEPDFVLDPIEKKAHEELKPFINKLLSEQTLPTLKRRTDKSPLPWLGDSVELATKLDNKTLINQIGLLSKNIEALKKQGKSEKEISAHELKLKNLQAIKAKVLPQDGEKGVSEQVTIKDEGAPPRPALSNAMKGDVESVIAKLLADPRGNAEKMLTDIRKTAFPNGILETTYHDLGVEEIDPLSQILTSELRAIAVDAGISKESLDIKLADEKLKIEEEKKSATLQMSLNLSEGKGGLSLMCKEEGDLIAGAKATAQKKTEEQLEAISGDNDPKVIELKATRIRGDVHKKVGEQRVYYDQALKRRNEQLDPISIKYTHAYEASALREEQALTADGKQDTTNGLAAAEIRLWKDEQIREATREFLGLKKAAFGEARNFKENLENAGRIAVKGIDTWEKEKTNVQKSWWERLKDTIKGWATQSQAETEAWEEVKVQESRDALVGDFQSFDTLIKYKEGELTEESIQADEKLSDEQKAILLTYYGKGSNAGNSILAVAAGMRVRLKNQHKPQITEKFYGLLEAKPASDWEYINGIAAEGNEGFNADHNRNELRQAMKGWGTDEDRVYAALTGLSQIERIALDKCYEATHKTKLKDDIEDEFSSQEEDRAMALLEGKTDEADAAALKDAMEGGWFFGAGTDEDLIMKTLRNKSEEERQALIEIYKKKYGKDLNEKLKDELSSHDLDRANALMEGDTAKADAIAIDQAMHGGSLDLGIGTEEKAIETTYQDIRNDVEAEAAKHNWKTADIEAEIKRRNQNVEASYNKKYGKDNIDLKAGESALRAALKGELSDGELNLANALADNDLTKADAARIAIERESIVYASDDKINEVLEGQYKRALREMKRDGKKDMDKEFDRRQEQAKAEAEKNGKKWVPWDRYKIAEEKRKLEAELEQSARAKATGYMNDLEKAYDDNRGFSGGLRLDIALNTSGYDGDKAVTLLNQKGYLTPVQQIEFATDGGGTAEETLKGVFEGKTVEEIEQIKADWGIKHPNENIYERVVSELSGRDEFDTTMAMRGLPKSIHHDIYNMRERYNWELSNTDGAKALSFIIGGPLGADTVYQSLGGEEEAILRDRMAFMEKQYAILNNPNLGDKRDRELADRLFQQGGESVDIAIKGYREQIDSVTDSIATGAAMTAAIVVGAILTAATGGAAGPGVVATISALETALIAGTSALAGLAAQVATKKILLGSAYGDEDIYYDLGIGTIDVAAAMATAGIGAKALGALKLKGLGVKEIEDLIKHPKLVNRLLANFVVEGAEGGLGALPSALAGNIFNDQVWATDDPLTTILEGTATQVGISFAMSGGMAAVGGIKNPNLGKNADIKGVGHEHSTNLPHGSDLGNISSHPDVVKSSSLPDRLKPVNGEMRAGVPSDVHVYVDPHLRGDTVRVHYELDANGLVRNVHMRLGPGATAADVKLHIDTAKTMKRYGGLMGRVRKLLSEIKEHVGLKGDFPTGSKAWEAKLEVEKLPRKIQKRLRELQNPHLDAKTKLEIESDIRNLEGQLAVHKQTLDSKVTTEGRGYVAADSEVDWSKASKEEKAKILEKHKMPTLEDLGLNPNEYKYVKTKSKDPPFSIWKVDNSGVPSLRLQKENGNWHLEKGKLSGEAEAKAILAGLSEEKAKAYQHLQNQLPESKLLFPLKKIAVTGVTFGELHGVNDSFFEQLTNVLAGAGKSRGEIEVLIDRLKTHKLMVIEGTGQLRRFDYRTFGGGVHGDGLEMHHAMPLWLGGTHEGGNLAGLNKEAHKEIHELFNSLQFDKNTALIPSILQKSSNLSFSEGAAIIDKDTGNIEFLQFNSSSELVSVTKKN